MNLTINEIMRENIQIVGTGKIIFMEKEIWKTAEHCL